MAEVSDGVIVGSAIMKLVAEHGKEAPKYVGEYVKRMKEACTGEDRQGESEILLP